MSFSFFAFFLAWRRGGEPVEELLRRRRLRVWLRLCQRPRRTAAAKSSIAGVAAGALGLVEGNAEAARQSISKRCKNYVRVVLRKWVWA